MRACEGEADNPFCYHRVATLADRQRPTRARRYLPMAIAPAAILALVGCSSGGGGTPHAVDAGADALAPLPVGWYGVGWYGVFEPTGDGSAPDDASEAGEPLDGAPDAVDAYDADLPSDAGSVG